MSQSAEEISNESKLRHRSSLKLEDWQKYKYYKDSWCENVINNPPVYKIDIEEYQDLSKENFIKKYERLSKPLIIKGGTKEWKANKNWNFEVFLN
jgi:histone arginine demethylase JMJD6